MKLPAYREHSLSQGLTVAHLTHAGTVLPKETWEHSTASKRTQHPLSCLFDFPDRKILHADYRAKFLPIILFCWAQHKLQSNKESNKAGETVTRTKTKVEGTCLPCVLILALKKQQWHNPSYSCKLTWPLYFWINAAELAWATHNSMGRKGALSCQEHRSISTATAAAHHNWHKHKPASHLHMTYSMWRLLSP